MLSVLVEYKLDEEMATRPLSGVTRTDLEQMIENYGISELHAESLEETLKLWGVMPIANEEGCVYFIRLGSLKFA